MSLSSIIFKLEGCMDETYGLWGQKNATLSDRTAEKEYGISRKKIRDAINAGELQFRVGSVC
jgi:hypothetical protein